MESDFPDIFAEPPPVKIEEFNEAKQKVNKNNKNKFKIK